MKKFVKYLAQYGHPRDNYIDNIVVVYYRYYSIVDSLNILRVRVCYERNISVSIEENTGLLYHVTFYYFQKNNKRLCFFSLLFSTPLLLLLLVRYESFETN